MDFYCGALGFVPGEVMEISSGLDGIMELTGVSLRSQFIRRPDGFALELLELRSPEPFGPRERRPLNQFGLTHLSFYVESLEASMAELVRCGGAVYAGTLTFLPSFGVRLVYCSDPDGVRIELMQLS